MFSRKVIIGVPGIVIGQVSIVIPSCRAPFGTKEGSWKRRATVGRMDLTIFGISDLAEIQQNFAGVSLNPNKFPKLFSFRLDKPRELGGAS